MKGLTLTVSLRWIKEEPSCLTCYVCADIIYSNTYRLNFLVNSKPSTTEIVTCESCYEFVK